MRYWILKTEPSVYSFNDLLREKRTCWDGITNPAALKNLRAASVGDRAVIYHTGDEKRAVGLAEIVRAAYPDPKAPDPKPGGPKRVVVDLAADVPFPSPVTLATIKSDPIFGDSPLVRQGRLSFVPLTTAEWGRLAALAKLR